MPSNSEPTYQPTSKWPSFSPIEAPQPGQPTEVIVQTTLTVSGVTPSNFDSLKADLKVVIADYFAVNVADIELELVDNSGRRQLQSAEIIVTITAMDAEESADIVSDMRQATFVQDISHDISNAGGSLSGVTVTGSTPPQLVTTTTTTTTTAAGSTTTLMSILAFILSALVF